MILTDFFNLISSRKISVPNKLFPVKVFAIVKEIDKNHALLRLNGREILARIDVQVKKGEYLLLEQKGFLEGKTYFKVLQRSLLPLLPEEEILLTKPLLVDLGKGQSVPIVIKYYLEHKDENNRNENSADVPQKRKKFDFMIETKNLGLIVFSIEITNNGYMGKFFVESQESRVLLDSKLKDLNITLTAAAKELNIHFEVTSCEIMSAVVSQGTKMLFEGSFVLDRKV
jgi:hypothetical protein